jgi:outer membrane protein
VGVFSLAQWQPYQGVKANALVLPYIGFDNGTVKWQGPVVEAQLGSTASQGAVPTRTDPHYALSLRAQYMGDGYTADDSPFLAGMQTRRASVWMGPSATARFSWGQVSGQWLVDGMGHSKGHQARVAASTLFPLGPVWLAPRIAWVWQDSKTIDYYYGVRRDEVLPGRHAYEGRSGSSFEVGVSSVVPLDAKQALVVDVAALKLGSAIQDSPLVGRKYLTNLRMAYTYRF